MVIRETDILSRRWSVADSFAFCERLARTHYENFPVASWLLPRDKRKYVAAIYAFARIADDFADEPGYTLAERVDGLTQWRSELEQCREGVAGHPVFVALLETIKRFDIPIDLFEHLLDAFQQDVMVHRYETFQDVLEYCNNSANPIGRLVLLLFNYRNQELFEWSDAVCTALQLTNFWQDLSVDIPRDRLYLPQEDLDKFNYSESDLRQLRYTARFKGLMEFEIDRTQDLFDLGKPLLTEVGRDVRRELKLTWLGGARILQKIRAQNYNVLSRRPLLSTRDKAALLTGSLFS
ncbi:MAG: squalene synthase HpnC [Ignavibacteriales bacterium]|nr:squalene synthase HpnC [Ignavibacteriales bacterium]